MEKDIKENLQNKIKNEFVSFLDDLLNVFPKNKNLFMCRIITHQVDKEEVCDMLHSELYDCVNDSFKTFTQDKMNSLFEMNLLNYKENITNCIQFKLNDLYNISNVNDHYEEYNNCIYNWMNILVYLLKQLKQLKTIN